MGNGNGLGDEDDLIHPATPAFTQQQLEDAVAKSVANFGRPHILLASPLFFDYEKTPWKSCWHLTKREKVVSKLQVFLFDLNILNKWEKEDIDTLVSISRKRLKRAKWARYQKQ